MIKILSYFLIIWVIFFSVFLFFSNFSIFHILCFGDKEDDRDIFILIFFKHVVLSTCPAYVLEMAQDIGDLGQLVIHFSFHTVSTIAK